MEETHIELSKLFWNSTCSDYRKSNTSEMHTPELNDSLKYVYNKSTAAKLKAHIETKFEEH